MATRSISFSTGEFYHIYNRGTDRRIIFTDTADYKRFIDLLYLCNSSVSVNYRNISRSGKNIFEFNRKEQLVSIGAYCLMPNHFHIIATPHTDDGLGIFMNKLCTSYSMYFNKRNERTGTLFQGNYKAKHAGEDEYLKYLYSYIHLNPVKLYQSDWVERGIKNLETAYKFVSTYQYSSLPDHLGLNRPEKAVLDSSPFPDYFSSHIDMKKELFEWLAYNTDILKGHQS
ncbi:transposase [Candidatus Nomurabacteria bacterium]|nr:transposase [Candidatus Kaiserbacteria bacterium]MCB9809965.1 transposase [Candidatus Nomurabacteria bacterium]MCB9815120.1 transposase [Candidatus Nomurabacteria bacterium]